MSKNILFSIIITMALIFGLIIGCAPVAEEPASEELAEEPIADESMAEETPGYQWVMVTSGEGLGDQGYNDLSYASLQKVVEKYGGEITVVESRELAQLVPNLTASALTDPDLIVGVGFDLYDAINEVAALYPEINFAILDSAVELPNVASVIFRQNEGSFLGGVMAGLMTQTGTVGFIGGQEFPDVISWQAGWLAGVKTSNPDATTLNTYAGTFGDPVIGREAALAMYNNDADIILEVCSGTALGIFEAAKELGNDKYVVGVDICKHYLAPDNTLPSVVKRVDLAIMMIADDIVAGNFPGGQVISMGLAEGGMGMCMERYEELVPEEVRAKIEKAKELILNGEIVIPTTREEVDSFTPPVL